VRKPLLIAAKTVMLMCGVASGTSACFASSGQGLPIVLCGATVYGGGAEGFWYDMAVDNGGTAVHPNVDGTIILMVGSCDKGSHVTWTPPSAARIVQSVYAKDGLLAVVRLQPTSEHAVFTVTVTQHSKVLGTATYGGY
jgi:hypothetical protein